MKFLNTAKLTLFYYIASITSYVVMCCCEYFNLLYDPFDTNVVAIDFCITLFVVGTFFAVLGSLSKEKSIFQLLILCICNIVACVLLIAYDGSFINYLLIAFDSVLLYAYQFFFYNVVENDCFSYTVALLLSCFYPITVFLIFKLLVKVIKRIFKAIREAIRTIRQSGDDNQGTVL